MSAAAPEAAAGEEPRLAGHLTATTDGSQAVHITVAPEGATQITNEGNGRWEPLKRGQGRLPCVIPTVSASAPWEGRKPLPYEPQGYMHILPRGDGGDASSVAASAVEPTVPDESVFFVRDASAGESANNFVSAANFEQLAAQYKDRDGKFLAMTHFGAMPLPDAMLRGIPEKLVTKPSIAERDVFVLKKDERLRVIHKEYTQFEHKFVKAERALDLEQVVVEPEVSVREVPLVRYKPYIAEKIIEIPKGVKFTEVPIEVRCQAPPRIVPVPKVHTVERRIETTKPVVQEKIVEVPEIIRKRVPKIVYRDIPVCVPRHVEKIIEVPYRPGQKLPPPSGAIAEVLPKPPPLVTESVTTTTTTRTVQRPAGAAAEEGAAPLYITPDGREQLGFGPDGQPVFAGAPPPQQVTVDGDTLVVEAPAAGGYVPPGPQTYYMTAGIKHVKLPYEAQIDIDVVEESEIPAGAAIAQPGVRYMAPGGPEVAYAAGSAANPAGVPYYPETEEIERVSVSNNAAGEPAPIYLAPMEPIVRHSPPGMRAVRFRTASREPEILTRQGVMKFSRFENCMRNEPEGALFPPLPHHDLVPMTAEGRPDVQALAHVQREYAKTLDNALTVSSGAAGSNAP